MRHSHKSRKQFLLIYEKLLISTEFLFLIDYYFASPLPLYGTVNLYGIVKKRFLNIDILNFKIDFFLVDYIIITFRNSRYSQINTIEFNV